MVADVMSTALVTIEDTATLADAADLMARHRTRHLLVTCEGVFVGLVSDRDLRLALPSRFSESADAKLHASSVLAVCFQNPYCISPDASMSDAADLMVEHRIGSLPVIKNGELVGIVTASDFVAAFRSENATPPRRADKN